MEVVADLPADPQAAEPVQVRKGPLHRPAFGTESGAVLGATSGDDRLDSQVPGKAAVFVSVGPVAAGERTTGPRRPGAETRTPGLSGPDPI